MINMGNYRFKLSDMIPNAWFYRLKDMGRKSSRNQKKTTRPTNKKASSTSSSSSSSNIATPPLSATTVEQPYQRKSYHFTRDLLISSIPIPISPPAANDHHDRTLDDDDDHSASQTTSSPKPRKSSKKKRRNVVRAISSSSSSSSSSSNNHTNCCNISRSSIPTAGCSCGGTLESVSKPDSCTTPQGSPSSPLPSTSSSHNQSLVGAHEFDEREPLHHHHPPPTHPKQSSTTHELLLHLPPIIAKPAASASRSNPSKEQEQKKTSTTAAAAAAATGGLKLRINSPRIANRRIPRKSLSSSSSSRRVRGRRSVSAESLSFAVVKSSEDPQRDFRESMVEMIVENNICASTDLEDLLACYLSLNSHRYHDLIIRVFKQIWFDIFLDLHPISL